MIRLANILEIDEVLEVINDAKALFKSEGSDQWQDRDNYPNYETIKKDIERNELYVKLIDGLIVGCVVLSDLEENAYLKIYDGKWETSGHYMTLHRIAVRNGYYKRGIAKELINKTIEIAKIKNVSSIKVDTKETNIRMMNLLIKMGFKVQGKINLLRDGVIDKVRTALEYKI